jgi:tRNA 2-thiouridine synthesizing protein C
MMKKTLIINRCAPWEENAQGSLDLALAFATVEFPLTLLFIGQGALQLLPDNPLAKMLSALPVYGVEEFYLAAENLPELPVSIENLILPVKVLSSQGITELTAKQDVIFNF